MRRRRDFFVLYARGRLAEMPTGSEFGNFFILVHFFLDKKIRLFYLAVQSIRRQNHEYCEILTPLFPIQDLQ